ncbi:hypothetical protein KFK09_003495 [Dendrobium nobile]|uniref:Uncharacterized protein n=1 Tax=Dendrobium nobile TaxID=94219 RepID=A0A8T3C3B7_DENNO|nr:hypothetical protein KFK09_003495 [Dendrobium nobile]
MLHHERRCRSRRQSRQRTRLRQAWGLGKDPRLTGHRRIEELVLICPAWDLIDDILLEFEKKSKEATGFGRV